MNSLQSTVNCLSIKKATLIDVGWEELRHCPFPGQVPFFQVVYSLELQQHLPIHWCPFVGKRGVAIFRSFAWPVGAQRIGRYLISGRGRYLAPQLPHSQPRTPAPTYTHSQASFYPGEIRLRISTNSST